MPTKKKSKKVAPVKAIKMVVHHRVLETGVHQYAFSGILVSDTPLTNIDPKEGGAVVLESANELHDVDTLHAVMSLFSSRASKNPGLSLGQAVVSLKDL